MNYDNYKLSNPLDEGRDGDLVTSCCGGEESIKENLCDDSKIYYCEECGEDDYCYELIEQYEYDERQREYYAEMQSDEDI